MEYEQVAVLWHRLYVNDPTHLRGWKPHHLLDALFFLKVYSSEDVHSGFSGCDPKTLRKWNWIVIEAIAQLDCVSFLSPRRKYSLLGRTCL